MAELNALSTTDSGLGDNLRRKKKLVMTSIDGRYGDDLILSHQQLPLLLEATAATSQLNPSSKHSEAHRLPKQLSHGTSRITILPYYCFATLLPPRRPSQLTVW